MLEDRYFTRSLNLTWIAQLGRRFGVQIALVTLLTLLINLVGIDHAPFWPDEAYTVLQVRSSTWDEMLLTNLRNEETPPLYFALLRLWSLAIGSSTETALRSFSALALTATVPLVGLLGRRLWNRRVGLTAALLLAVNPFAHYYGQEARAYALALLLTTIVILVGHQYERRPHLYAWIGYVIAGTLAFYTNYFTAFTLAGVGAIVAWALFCRWWRERRPEQLWPVLGWVSAQLMILALYIPWLPALIYQYRVAGSALAPDHTPLWSKAILTILALGVSFPDGKPLSILLFLLIVIALPIALLVVSYRGGASQKLWLMGTIAAPFLGATLLLSGDGQFTPRYTLQALPGYLVLLSAGLLLPVRYRLLLRGLLATFVVCSIAYSLTIEPSRQRQGGWDQAAEFVTQQARPGDAIFFAPPWCQPAFNVQYDGPVLAQFGASSFAQYYYERGRPFTELVDQPALDAQLGAGRRAWIVWDRSYARRIDIPSATVERHDLGTTTLLLITPDR